MESILYFTILYTLVVLGVLYLYFKWSFQYWEKKGVPYPEADFPFGTIKDSVLAKRNISQIIQEQYNFFKKQGEKHFGFYLFMKPMYIPIDLDIIKHILIKDFNSFFDRGVFVNEKDDPLSAHLFSTEGNRWKTLRAKISPTFTSGKMKMMFNTLLEVGKQLESEMEKISDKEGPFDAKDVATKYTLDVIASCSLGLEHNSFQNPDSEFRKCGDAFLNPDFLMNIKGLLGMMFPNLVKKLHMTVTTKELRRFFTKVIGDTVEFREKNNVQRNDFMQLLIELKNGKSDELGNLTINEIAAQAFVFYLAGFETSSTIMNYCLFELSQQQDIQDKARREINEVLEKYDGKFTYEGLKEMKYLTQCIEETLRKYPPIPILNRLCMADYKVPGTNVILDAKTPVFISINSIHNDPELYPDPDRFDPNRFTDEEKVKRHPFAYIPFGEGPRNCIGLRFGMMQTRVGLATMLKDYKLTLNEKTELPLTFEPYNFILKNEQTVWLDSEQITR